MKKRIVKERKMKYAVIVAAVVAGLAVAVERFGAGSESGDGRVFAAAKGDRDRGEYIVNNVAMCIQCHTPRNGNGELIRSQLLKGAPIPVSSPYPKAPWATRAPTISGLPGYSDEAAIRLLTEGKTRRGSRPQAPMPPFRLTLEDAEAVVAYLRSLP